ncbi:MAG TPA: hypothetical protein VHC41_05795 [Mycobacteriales bacterium]|jgi:hypothetical protein|nr:hypothetical protein [Mycobacteriales bacterium]
MRPKRLFSLLVAGVALVGTLGVAAGTAQAADPYPPTSCPTISLTATTVAAGGSLTVTACGYTDGSQVSIDVFSTPVHIATLTAAGANGSVSADVTLPCSVEPGSHHFEVTGTDRQTGAVLKQSAAFTVTQSQACPASVVTPTENSGGSGGSLPFTGLELAAMLLAAAALIALGTTFVVLTRRRRQAAA